jgi:hypothetical protein
MATPLCDCHSCATGDAIVFCLLCCARLCLHCDASLHGATAAAGLHPRVPLCDACRAAPSALRDHHSGHTLCSGCAARVAPAGARTTVTQYTGCPEPAELLRLISAEAPQSHDDFEVWLANKLPHLLDDDDGGGGGQLTEGWDVALETAKLERMLAECQAADPSPAAASFHQLQPQQAVTMSGTPPVQPWQSDALPFCTMTMPESTEQPPRQQQQQQQQDGSAKKREERERAKLRYNEKKKKRRSLISLVIYILIYMHTHAHTIVN